MSNSHSEDYKRIGRKIAYYRNIKGLTQQQLADEVGISLSYLGKIESPNTFKSFSLDVLWDIADALDLDIVNLLK